MFFFLFFWRFKIMGSVLERADMYCSLASYKALSSEWQRFRFKLRGHVCTPDDSAGALCTMLTMHSKKATFYSQAHFLLVSDQASKRSIISTVVLLLTSFIPST